MNKLNVLIVEDFESDAILVARALGKAGYSVLHERVETADEFRAALARQVWDVVITDFSVPGFGALPVLEIMRQGGLAVPVFVVSSRAGEEAAVAVIKAGARDYLRKDHLSLLGDSVKRELEAAAAKSGTPDGPVHLKPLLQTVITEADKLLQGALPSGVLQGHARKLREACAAVLAKLDS